MFEGGNALLLAFAYIAMLFAVAFYAEKCADKGRSLIANPYVYALSLAVYASSWTFYGSVGRAAHSGVGFLPVYLGPTLVAAIWGLLLRKMIRISKANRITSIADFIGWRYGKSGALAGLVTVVATVSAMPYIALQLKAVSTSFAIMVIAPDIRIVNAPGIAHILKDTTFYVALFLAAFSILFGTRHLDATERHEGMVAAIALESLVKLAAFVAVGVFVTYGVYDGFTDIFTRAAAIPRLQGLLTLGREAGGYEGWTALMLVSFLAVLCLPRQFQMGVVENVNENHVMKATWLFPLYMLAINIFVLPIALAGAMRFQFGTLDADFFVLTLPISEHRQGLALFAFVGGLSAAISMIVVETLALSIMICNDLVMPIILRWKAFRSWVRDDASAILIGVRRASIVVLLLLGYVYYRAVGEGHALVAIGLLSFTAVAQFAPAMFGGMYWRQGTGAGAITGMTLGFIVWLYSMLLPSFADSGWLEAAFVRDGPFGIALLRPRQLFGLESADPVTTAIFWSLFFNVAGYVGVSLFTRPSAREHAQALLFVDAFKSAGKGAMLWRGSASIGDLMVVTRRFLGQRRSDEAFAGYASRVGVANVTLLKPDADLVHFAETLLAGVIGTATARVMVSSVVREESLNIDEVFRILDEASQVIAYSHQLEEKSEALQRAGAELAAANQRLMAMDRIKDDFMSTVTHELRTPLTSIRALSEILLQSPVLDGAQRDRFLGIIVKETERLTRLINQVLDLAKAKAGRTNWHPTEVALDLVLHEALASMEQRFAAANIELEQHIQSSLPRVFVDRDALMQIFLNLLSNAVKFCDPAHGKVRVVLDSVGPDLRVQVSDNGHGIRHEDQALIFERFVQLIDPVSGRPEGSGLGLAISRHIAAQIGARLWVESEFGQGTHFYFALPREPHAATE